MELLATKFGNSKYISLHGLWGTYEDCVTWLAGGLELDTPERVTFLWMGNSVANLHHSEARSLLSRFSNACDTSGIEFQFIASIDACEREAKILTAYDESSEHLRNFIMNGLTTANTIFGREVFRCEDWTFTTEFDANQHELQVSYVPRCDAKVEIEGKCFIVQEGRKIRAITSGKWPERAVRLISKDIELSVSNVWRDEDAEYC